MRRVSLEEPARFCSFFAQAADLLGNAALHIFVVAVVGGLAWLLHQTVSFRRCATGTGWSACNCNVRILATVLEMWATDHHGRLPLRLEDLTPGYLKAVPTCPGAGRVTYEYFRLHREGCHEFEIRCGGTTHVKLLSRLYPGVDAADFPRYASWRGMLHP